MVLGVDLRLDVEQPLRVAEMGDQGRRRLGDRAKEVAEDRAVGVGDRVGNAGSVEGDGAVVGVDGRLDGVPDVVDTVERRVTVDRRGAREAVARRVGVDHPHQPAVGDHQVRIVIQREERRDRLDPVPHLAADQDPRFVRHLGAEHDPAIAKKGRQDDPAQRIARARSSRRRRLRTGVPRSRPGCHSPRRQRY